jgi:hypothetical protein
MRWEEYPVCIVDAARLRGASTTKPEISSTSNAHNTESCNIMHTSNMHVSMDMAGCGGILYGIILCIMCIYVISFDLYLMVAVWYGVKASSLIFADESDPCSTGTAWLFWNGILALIVLIIGCTMADRKKRMTPTQGYNNMDQNRESGTGGCGILVFVGLWVFWLCKGPARLKSMDEETDDDECDDVHNWVKGAIIGGFCALGIQALFALCSCWVATAPRF